MRTGHGEVRGDRLVKVLLMNPPTAYEDLQGSELEPLGLCYLAAVARQAGHEVLVRDLCDTRSGDVDTFFHEIDEFAPQVLGVTAMSHNYARGLEIARVLKARYACTTVFGGWHVSGTPQTVADPAIDYVVRGEGEETFVELLSHLETGSPARSNIQGLAYEEDGRVHVNCARERIMALDDLPRPERIGLPIGRYCHAVLLNRPMSQMTTLSIQGSRGCPYKCTFCQTPAIWGNLWRRRDPASIADEIEHLIETYGINSLLFRDEEFTLNKGWVISVAKELTRRGIPRVLEWGSFCRVDDIDRELMEALKEAGYCYGFLGIEAGTPEARERLQKHYKQDEAEKAVRLFHEYDITSHGGWIIGFPWDTREGLERQFQWIRTLPLDIMTMSYAMPFDATAFGREMREQGMLLSDDTDRITLQRPVLRTPLIPTEELTRIRSRFMRRFYFHPHYLARLTRRVFLRPLRLQIFAEFLWQHGRASYFGPDPVVSEFRIPATYLEQLSTSPQVPGGLESARLERDVEPLPAF
jgi:radical SAM superfamily enzyme YgiQ (UPF0313 family)